MKFYVSAVVVFLLTTLGGSLQAHDPFSLTEAPFGSPAMDGNIADWMSMRNESNVLNFSFTHRERENDAQGSPLDVNIQYAWDQTNFYFLVEELSDDDPSSGLTDLDWCQECVGSLPGPAPWSTDSVGFYDQGITWPADGVHSDDIDPLSTATQEVGPYTQFWVGLPTADDMVIDGEKQNYHLSRSLDVGGGEGASARLIGDRSEVNTHTPMIPDLPALDMVQSAHGIIDDGSNAGRGRRFTEAFMRWDQIRYPDPEKNPNIPTEMADRIAAINDPDDVNLELDLLKGHYVEDIAEGYEFRLDPLLVDGLSEPADNGEFPFGGQTHPSGKLHPNVAEVQAWADTSIVRLVAGATVEVPTCVVPDGSVLGDLDQNGSVAFADFLTLSANFGASDVPYEQGDIDCDGNVAFADFLALSANFGQTSAAKSVPEPSSFVAIVVAGAVCLFRRRKR